MGFHSTRRGTAGHRQCRVTGRRLEVGPLLTAHPGIVAQLVPGLLTVYIDVEYTERENQFNEKFQMRLSIAELLSWLWGVPQHRATWRRTCAIPATYVPHCLAAHCWLERSALRNVCLNTNPAQQGIK